MYPSGYHEARKWKILRDPYLGPLAAKHGDAYALRAGFFYDEDPEDAALDDVDWRCTPVPTRAVRGLRPVVLLTTGAFCPVHDGHLEMMKRAKLCAERAGFEVLAGYLSPGHDAYVRMKCGPAAIPASERLRQCASRIAATADATFLLVDPWEALHRRVSVNYTDVAARLRAYLRAHVDRRIDLLYVCGGDNARFGLSFVDDGGCVIVGRPGAEDEVASLRAELAGSARILWCDGDHPGASRAIRAPMWTDEAKKRVVVRIEDARAVRSSRLDPVRFEAFQRELVALLAETMGSGAVRTAPLRELDAEDDVISLDAMLPSKHALAVSRLFALGGYHAMGHVARPDARSLEEQIARIPFGEYVVRDDDRMTGGTLAAVRAMLPAKVRVRATHLAVEHASDEEVADSRDFLLGTDDGGLVVQLAGGRKGRAPYVFPYVDPSVRCSVPPSSAHAFSRRVWALGQRAFHETGLCVRDLPEPSRVVVEWLGQDRPVADVCRWHLEHLERTIPL
jgi:hypothetical protein